MNCVERSYDGREGTCGALLHRRSELYDVKTFHYGVEDRDSFRETLVIKVAGHSLTLQYPLALDDQELTRADDAGGIHHPQRPVGYEDVPQDNGGVQVDIHRDCLSSSRYSRGS